MHVTVRVVLALLPLLAGVQPAFARCDPNSEPDRGDIAKARAAVAMCDCAAAASHRDYMRCAADAARATLVNSGCAGVVKHCASRSTCGKPGFVTCCRTKANGSTKCSTKSSADRCKDPKGGSSCVGTFASCCDACTATGCAGGGSPSGAFIDPIR